MEVCFMNQHVAIILFYSFIFFFSQKNVIHLHSNGDETEGCIRSHDCNSFL